MEAPPQNVLREVFVGSLLPAGRHGRVDGLRRRRPLSPRCSSRASGAPGAIAASRSSDWLQGGVADDNGLGPVLRRRLALGHDHRDGLTREDDLVPSKRLLMPGRSRRHDRQVGRGEDGDDACDLTRFLGIHRLDTCVWLGAQDKPGMEEPGKPQVPRVADRPGHLLDRVEPRVGNADETLLRLSRLAVARPS